MFTGIVEAMGVVESVEPRQDIVAARIRAPQLMEGVKVGSSIAVAGCCLTATRVSADGFETELTPETLRRTAFPARLRPGARVNLERPMRADGRFEGHVVQGHVDGTGTVRELRRLGESAELTVEAPAELLRYLVMKGSVTVDGVSLTIASLEGSVFGIALIPHTLEVTTLGELGPGAAVNLEVDVLAKYVERLLAARA